MNCSHRSSTHSTSNAAGGLPRSFPAEVRVSPQIENVDYHTDFSVEKAARKDSGIYTLKAENRNGKDEAQCELVVLGTSIHGALQQSNADFQYR